MLENLKKEHHRKMQEVVEGLDHVFDSLRTGRASIALVDHIPVDAYGSRMSLVQMATLATPDARTIVIQPFDPNQIKAIEKALITSDLGITPSNDGKMIRLNIPQLTEDRRKELVRQARKHAEEHRVGVRQVRHKLNDEIKRLQKDSEISEDDSHRLLDDVQKMTDDHIKKIDEDLAKKETEIMEV